MTLPRCAGVVVVVVVVAVGARPWAKLAGNVYLEAWWPWVALAGYMYPAVAEKKEAGEIAAQAAAAEANVDAERAANAAASSPLLLLLLLLLLNERSVCGACAERVRSGAKGGEQRVVSKGGNDGEKMDAVASGS